MEEHRRLLHVSDFEAFSEFVEILILVLVHTSDWGGRGQGFKRALEVGSTACA